MQKKKDKQPRPNRKTRRTTLITPSHPKLTTNQTNTKKEQERPEEKKENPKKEKTKKNRRKKKLKQNNSKKKPKEQNIVQNKQTRKTKPKGKKKILTGTPRNFQERTNKTKNVRRRTTQ